jgi:hypothetical protein
VLNLKSGQVETLPYLDLLQQVQHPDLYFAMSLAQEGHLAPPMFKGYGIDLSQTCLTFDNLLTKTPFVSLLKTVLKKLESAYGRPVDVEFAWDNERFYLLQCRAQPIREELAQVSLPADIAPEQILFTNDQGVSNSILKDIEFIVYVDPRAYGELSSYGEKVAVGRVVGKVNRFLEGKRYALFGPGRWGSNDINLGVRVGYGDINRTLMLGEIAFEEGGSTPEVSYGTHFFSDLVEARIVPIAIYPDRPETAFNEVFLLQSPNLLASIVPNFSACSQVVHVIHVPVCTDGRLLQVYQNGQDQRGMGFFAHRDAAA